MHTGVQATSTALTVKADDPVEANAATVVAPAPAMSGLTERQFSTTQKSPPSSATKSSDGTGTVIGVAAAALFVCLIGGLFWFRAQRATPDPNRALPKALPAAQRQLSEPTIRSPKPKGSVATPPALASEEPVLEFLPGDEAPPSAPPASAAPLDSRPGQKAGAPATSSSLPDPAQTNPSANPAEPWVKPSWAIPDGDPVRRAPIVE
jgi:hypothetical protein